MVVMGWPGSRTGARRLTKVWGLSLKSSGRVLAGEKPRQWRQEAVPDRPVHKSGLRHLVLTCKDTQGLVPEIAKL